MYRVVLIDGIYLYVIVKEKEHTVATTTTYCIGYTVCTKLCI